MALDISKAVLMALLFLRLSRIFAQSVEKEPAAVIELGAAAGRSLTEGRSAFGPAGAVEVTAIDDWLEMEAGVTPLFRRHSTEWSIDVLFKKPWTLSPKAEFFFGVGPEWWWQTGDRTPNPERPSSSSV